MTNKNDRNANVTGYPVFPVDHVGAVGTVNDWHGEPLGTARVVACWRLPRSCFVSDRMYQIECVIECVLYTGRGCGSNMAWVGKPKAANRGNHHECEQRSLRL